MITNKSFFQNTNSISLQKIFTFLCITLFLIPTLIVSIYFYYNTKQHLFSEQYKTLQNQFSQSADSLNTSFELINSTYFNLINDPILNFDYYAAQSYGYVYTKMDKNTIDRRLDTFLFYNMGWERKLIDSIGYLYNGNSTYAYNGESAQNITEDTALELHQLLNNAFFSSKQNQRINSYVLSQYNSDILYYVRDFYNFYSGNLQGIVLLRINQKNLITNFKYFDSYVGSFGFVVNRQGTIITSNVEALLNQSFSNAVYAQTPLADLVSSANDYLVYQTKLSTDGLTFYELVPSGFINSQLKNSSNNLLFILVIFTALIAFFTFFIPYKACGYLGIMSESIEQIKQGNYHLNIPHYGIREIDNFSDSFNYMSQEIDYLVNHVYKTELLLKNTEIQALQSQINPHFLFNILLSISLKALENQDTEVHQMITSLSSLLRGMIMENPNAKSTILQEVEICRLYLELQKYRFGNRLQYRIDIAPQIQNLFIPRLLLQPIVENAVTHGLGNKLSGGTVQILGEQTGEIVTIRIIDDGVGFYYAPPEDSCLSGNKNSSHAHIGLKNCKDRILQIYGSDYSIDIDSELKKFTCITLKIPPDNSPVI